MKNLIVVAACKVLDSTRLTLLTAITVSLVTTASFSMLGKCPRNCFHSENFNFIASANAAPQAAEGDEADGEGVTSETFLESTPTYAGVYDIVVPTLLKLDGNQTPESLTVSVVSWNDIPLNQKINVSLSSRNSMSLYREDTSSGNPTSDSVAFLVNNASVADNPLVTPGIVFGSFQPTSLSGTTENLVSTLAVKLSQKPTIKGIYKGVLSFSSEVVDVE